MLRFYWGICLLSALFALQAQGQDSDPSIRVAVKKGTADCHLTTVIGRPPATICQTPFTYTVQNLGRIKIAADVLCGGSAENSLRRSYHFEVEPQKSAVGNVVATRLSADEQFKGSCFLEINGKRTEIYKDYQPEWR